MLVNNRVSYTGVCGGGGVGRWEHVPPKDGVTPYSLTFFRRIVLHFDQILLKRIFLSWLSFQSCPVSMINFVGENLCGLGKFSTMKSIGYTV